MQNKYNIQFTQQPLVEIPENERLLIAKVSALEKQLKSAQLKHTPYIPLIDNGEYVYMLITPQAYQIKDKCYKIGRCKDMIARKGGYPKNTKVLICFRTKNATELENKIKDAFKAHKNITQAKDYGTEYFRGKFTCMRRVFTNLYEEHNPDEEYNDEDENDGEDEDDE